MTTAPKKPWLWIGGIIFAVCVCLFLAVVFMDDIFSVFEYDSHNAERQDSMTNIRRFSDEIKKYISEHNGRYPDKKGVHGLCQLDGIVRYSELAAKDDRDVLPDYDVMRESNTSYAYVASGLSADRTGAPIPVLFEKPWGRSRILVLMSDGNIRPIDNKDLQNCEQVIRYLRGTSSENSPDWTILHENARQIDERHGR
ncbi:MAG: hypothetical protein IJS14_09385 [Lentisphaeria bacterium]|nr:hypothetical protein [Lentisphaeria bacterium]